MVITIYHISSVIWYYLAVCLICHRCALGSATAQVGRGAGCWGKTLNPHLLPSVLLDYLNYQSQALLKRRKLIWRKLWVMKASTISFITRATYDVLPSPKNLQAWYGEDPTCALCPTQVKLHPCSSLCSIGTRKAQPSPNQTRSWKASHGPRLEDGRWHWPANSLSTWDSSHYPWTTQEKSKQGIQASSCKPDSEEWTPLPCIVPWICDWAWDTSSGLITL